MASRSLKIFTVDDKKNKETSKTTTTTTTTLAIASRISGLQDGTRLNSDGGDGRSPEDVLDKRRLKGKLIDAHSPSVASLLPPPPARPARPLLPLELPSLSLDAIEVRFWWITEEDPRWRWPRRWGRNWGAREKIFLIDEVWGKKSRHRRCYAWAHTHTLANAIKILPYICFKKLVLPGALFLWKLSLVQRIYYKLVNTSYFSSKVGSCLSVLVLSVSKGRLAWI